MQSLSKEQARALVEARLGRPPQDVLETAVVLEAWGGLSSSDALTTASGLGSDWLESPGRVRPAPYAVSKRDLSVALGDIGFVIGVLFVGFWISSLASKLGEQGVDRAWRVALPFSLGAQWLLRRRYLSGEDGLGRLRNEAWVLALPVLGAGAFAAYLRPGGPMAAALVAIWIGGFLITRRGWGAAYGAALAVLAVAGSGLLGLRLNARVVIALAAGLSIGGAAAAIARAATTRRRPGPWRRSVPAGLVGAGMGLLLVLEPRFSWERAGWLPALTIVPSLVGSVWGGLHMTRLWEVMPQVLVSTSVRDRRHGRIGSMASRLLIESLARLACGVVLASAVVAAWAAATHRQPLDVMRNLLAAHAALAIAGLLVGLLEAFGRWGWALLATLLGAITALGVDRLLDRGVNPGERIAAGALVCVVAAAVPLVLLLREPDRNLAAAL